MKFVAEANLQASKFLSQTRNITELMNSIFKRLRSWLTDNQKLLKPAQNASKQPKKHKTDKKQSEVFSHRLLKLAKYLTL